MTDLIRWGLVLTGAVTFTLLVGFLSTVAPAEPPRYGHRGAERQRAMLEGGIFAAFEPAIRFLAGVVAFLPMDRIRKRQESDLRRADDVLGLSPDELSALSLVSAVVLCSAVSGIASVAQVASWYGPIAGIFGLLLPTIQVRDVIRQRMKSVTRALPPAIEIAAMTMGAGLDFPGALRLLCGRGTSQQSPLAREFSVILEHLEFGHTRKEALQGLADRVPSRPVGDFASAIIQAEEKGNPLARVLQIQGRMLNMKRSVAAEEAAARAGVLMILPMVLLVSAILLLLMGPFLVKGIGW